MDITKLKSPYSSLNYRFIFCKRVFIIPTHADYPECRLTDQGTEYLGFQSISASGAQCLEWVDTDYPEEDNNYCRNPDGRSTGPWCYVAEDEIESCDISFCKRTTDSFNLLIRLFSRHKCYWLFLAM